MYSARDIRPSSFVIPSVTERCLFDALHTTTAAKSAISIHYLPSSNLLFCGYEVIIASVIVMKPIV